MEKERATHDLRHTTSCAKHGGGSVMYLWLPMEHMITDDEAADRSSKINSEVFRAILSAHIQSNALKLIMWTKNDPKHTAIVTRLFEGKEMEYTSVAKSIF